MKLTISVENLNILRWWIDASYNIHDDCRGHTGCMLSLGKGAVISFSRKQKLNVRSSTEGELVGIDDAIGVILWSKYFVEAQGYEIEHNIIFQDNDSTALLAKNGRASSGKRTKHIKSRYFFIKDKVDSGEAEIKRCPTDLMWSDVLTKPKQGRPFRVLRSELQNVPIDYDDDEERLKTDPQLMYTKDELAEMAEKDAAIVNKTSQDIMRGRQHPSIKATHANTAKIFPSGCRVINSNVNARQRSVLGEIGNSLNGARPKNARNKVPHGTALKPQIRSARAG